MVNMGCMFSREKETKMPEMNKPILLNSYLEEKGFIPAVHEF